VQVEPARPRTPTGESPAWLIAGGLAQIMRDDRTRRRPACGRAGSTCTNRSASPWADYPAAPLVRLMHRHRRCPGRFPAGSKPPRNFATSGSTSAWVVIPFVRYLARRSRPIRSSTSATRCRRGLGRPRLKELCSQVHSDRGRDLHHTDRDSRRGRAEAPVGGSGRIFFNACGDLARWGTRARRIGAGALP